MSTDPLHICVIDEGHLGHTSQSAGVAQAIALQLEAQREVRIETLTLSAQLRGWQRDLLRQLAPALPRTTRRDLLNAFPALRLNPTTPPRLILSSGGKSLLPGHLLSLECGAPFVFIGERSPFSEFWAHRFYTPSHRENSAKDHLLERIPTRLRADQLPQAPKLPPCELPLRLLLIGGRSKSHPYSRQDWQSLGEAAAQLARQENFKWLVATSPRTGAEAEAVLQDSLPADLIHQAVWWATQPEKKLRDYFSAASEIYVTQDSVTMLSEAIDSGKATTILRPEHTDFSPTSFLPDYFGRLEQSGQAARLNFPQLAKATTRQPRRLSTTAAADGIARDLLNWLESSP